MPLHNDQSKTAGVKVLLMGSPGTGKTHAIRTLADAGLEVGVIFTEDGRTVLGDTDPEKVHWMYVPAQTADWDTMLANANMVNTMTKDVLLKQTPPNRNKYRQFVEVLNACKNFVCERTGKEMGDVASWDTSRVLVIDSLTGLNQIVMDLVVGGKPIQSLPDYGIAMDTEERFLNMLCLGMQAHVVVTGHISPLVDEVHGGVKNMVVAIGKKLGPTLPRFFSDVIVAEQAGGKFTWCTATDQSSAKARHVGWAKDLAPSFMPLVTRWRQLTQSTIAKET